MREKKIKIYMETEKVEGQKGWRTDREDWEIENGDIEKGDLRWRGREVIWKTIHSTYIAYTLKVLPQCLQVCMIKHYISEKKYVDNCCIHDYTQGSVSVYINNSICR